MEPAEDAAPAGWLTRDAGASPTFHTMVPEDFDVYARVFHPARLGDREVRWAEVAEANGRTMHGAAEWGQLTGSWKLDQQGGLWDSDPFNGHTPERQALHLGALLAKHTGTPQRCWFGVWEGWGGWRDPGSAEIVLVRTGTSYAERVEIERRRRERARADWAPWQSIMSRAPTFEMPSRTMHLVRCPLADIGSFYGDYANAPNIWWPEDRAWCVGSDVDLMSTYLGGTAAMVEAVTRERDLEALAIPRGQDVTWEADKINPYAGTPPF
jgi:hypothetical protein